MINLKGIDRIVFADKAELVKNGKKPKGVFDKQYLLFEKENQFEIILNITDGESCKKESDLNLATTKPLTILTSIENGLRDIQINEIKRIVLYKFSFLINKFNNIVQDARLFIEITDIKDKKIYIDIINHKEVAANVDVELKVFDFSEVEVIYEKDKKVFYKGYKINLKEYFHCRKNHKKLMKEINKYSN